MNYVGIDHHRQYSHLTLMDEEGQVFRSGRVGNLRAEIEKSLEGMGPVEAIIETGRSSYTMVDVLDEMGVTVKIVHPNEVKAIARAKIKTDKRDSEVLAHLLRMKMIPEVYRRSVENRQAQRVLRQRAFYVSAVTALKNRVHAFLAQQGDIVRATGLERGYISNLEAGKIKHPRIVTVAKVANAFGMKFSEFIIYCEGLHSNFPPSFRRKK